MRLKFLILIVVPCLWQGTAGQRRREPRPPDSEMVWKRPRYVMPWLKGPNVCAVEEVHGTGARYFTECMPTIPRKICGKQTFIRYQCCTGYEQADDGSSGCRAVAPVHTLMDSFEPLHLEDMEEYVRRAGLERTLEQEGPLTVFAPDRRAMRNIDNNIRNELATRDESRNLLRLHLVEGRHYLRNFRNGMVLPSMYDDEERGGVKINRYSNGVVTANCVRLTLPDQVASNGIIHITEKVVEPQEMRKSVMDVLMEDGRFAELVTGLIITDIGTELRNIDAESVTIFAPTDSAFRRAPELIERLFGQEGKELLASLLKYHIIDHNLCAAAIIAPFSYRSHEGQVINVTCDVNDRFLVNRVPVDDADILAQNGVIHVIDELLIPDTVKTVEDLLLEMDLMRFQEYAQQAGLSDVLTGERPGEYTFFVPNKEAFQRLTRQELLQIQTDSAVVRKVFTYHVVPQDVKSTDMTDGMSLPTLSGPPLKVQIYQKEIGVNSAQIKSANHKGGNGVIHVIDRVLFPPEDTAIEIIKEDSRLSTFAALLETSGLDTQLDTEGHFTILAPSNDAFNRLPTAFTEMLRLNRNELRKAISYHILEKPVFSSCIKNDLQYRYETLSGDWLQVRKAENVDYVIIGDTARVVQPDIESTSGVIHIIDDVLQCPCVESFQNWGI